MAQRTQQHGDITLLWRVSGVCVLTRVRAYLSSARRACRATAKRETAKPTIPPDPPSNHLPVYPLHTPTLAQLTLELSAALNALKGLRLEKVSFLPLKPNPTA